MSRFGKKFQSYSSTNVQPLQLTIVSAESKVMPEESDEYDISDSSDVETQSPPQKSTKQVAFADQKVNVLETGENINRTKESSDISHKQSELVPSKQIVEVKNEPSVINPVISTEQNILTHKTEESSISSNSESTEENKEEEKEKEKLTQKPKGRKSEQNQNKIRGRKHEHDKSKSKDTKKLEQKSSKSGEEKKSSIMASKINDKDVEKFPKKKHKKNKKKQESSSESDSSSSSSSSSSEDSETEETEEVTGEPQLTPEELDIKSPFGNLKKKMGATSLLMVISTIFVTFTHLIVPSATTVLLIMIVDWVTFIPYIAVFYFKVIPRIIAFEKRYVEIYLAQQIAAVEERKVRKHMRHAQRKKNEVVANVNASSVHTELTNESLLISKEITQPEIKVLPMQQELKLSATVFDKKPRVIHPAQVNLSVDPTMEQTVVTLSVDEQRLSYEQLLQKSAQYMQTLHRATAIISKLMLITIFVTAASLITGGELGSSFNQLSPWGQANFIILIILPAFGIIALESIQEDNSGFYVYAFNWMILANKYQKTTQLERINELIQRVDFINKKKIHFANIPPVNVL